MYVAKFYIKTAMVDNYDQGCDPDTSRVYGFDERFEADIVRHRLFSPKRISNHPPQRPA